MEPLSDSMEEEIFPPPRRSVGLERRGLEVEKEYEEGGGRTLKDRAGLGKNQESDDYRKSPR
jgi:hypothetical protein